MKVSTRLCGATIADLPDDVATPAYDRAQTSVGIVHLGNGAFHKAHEAVYTDDVLAQGAADWAIMGVSLRSPRVPDAMAPQDGLYTVIERGAAGERLRVIGAITDVAFAPADPASLIARMADPDVRIVSLTVTEKGYCHDPATGRLDTDHPDIHHDLGHLETPRSAVGYLTTALARRKIAGAPPFTVLCCDNVPANGETLRSIVLDFAGRVDAGLAAWIEESCAFPSTMVDRIVPATIGDDLASLETRLGVSDQAAVLCEPFRQWVIEDNFVSGRPAWEDAGAEMVADVAPYEVMKLRLLNGSHSTLAYLGYLAGFETVAETMASPPFATFIRRLMDDEVTPTLNVPAGADVGAYKSALIERFANPALRHRNWQIAMDGSQKLPQRLLGTIRDRLAAGGGVQRLALGVAAWMRYVTGIDETGRPIEVSDPLSERLGRIGREAKGEPNALMDAMLALGEIFGDDLARSDPFRAALGSALLGLYGKGARRMVEETNGV
jgi:fructuronate reductase